MELREDLADSLEAALPGITNAIRIALRVCGLGSAGAGTSPGGVSCSRFRAGIIGNWPRVRMAQCGRCQTGRVLPRRPDWQDEWLVDLDTLSQLPSNLRRAFYDRPASVAPYK